MKIFSLFTSAFASLCLALSIAVLSFTGAVSYAQNDTAASVVERYGNLDVERTGPTIDAQLAQKYYRRGNTYSNLQRYDEAIAEYRKAISADPNLADAIRNLANTYFFLEQYAAAKPLFARFINMQTSTTAALIAAVSTLANLERKDGNYEKSFTYDLRAIELDPNNDSQVHIMANTYNNAGEADKAIEIYRAASKVMPDNAFLDRSLGRILEQENRLQEALIAYESAAAKNPDSDFYEKLVETTKNRIDR
ncbi:MAG: tetratricopeptide repeat protein [Pseudohongiella sp.]|jgi:tetratricopeptide (TPR) repeat protein|nr:tetratricopeptide repeat protein [Pseudohongiella sp.]